MCVCVFLIHMSIIWIYICNELCSSSRLAGHLSWQNLNVGTIDFYHFIPISLTLTMPGVTRSEQSKASFSHTLFI